MFLQKPINLIGLNITYLIFVLYSTEYRSKGFANHCFLFFVNVLHNVWTSLELWFVWHVTVSDETICVTANWFSHPLMKILHWLGISRFLLFKSISQPISCIQQWKDLMEEPINLTTNVKHYIRLNNCIIFYSFMESK